MQDSVKQDINFLENPIWFQDEVSAKKNKEGYIWKDKEGYVYSAGYRPPVKTDMIFLMYLLLKSQQNGWTDMLEITRYEIIKNCGLQVKQDWYNRLEDSLKRWKKVELEFKGSFYDNKTYRTLNFGIIDAWGIEEGTKKVWIRFSPEWLLRVKSSKYFKLLDFEMIRKLRSPLVTRLYEILIKSFQGRSEWQIDSLKLAQKIPMKEKYASDIRIKIEPAVRRIYDQTDLKVTVESVKQGRGKILFVFRIKTDMKQISDESQKEAPEEPKQDEKSGLQSLLNLVPIKVTDPIRKLISDYHDSHGHEYVKRNLEYTNSQIRDKRKYRAYLGKSLVNDYALEWIEDKAASAAEEKVRIKAETEKQKKATEKRVNKKDARRLDLHDRIKEELKAMPAERIEELRKGCLKDAAPYVRARLEKMPVSRLVSNPSFLDYCALAVSE